MDNAISNPTPNAEVSLCTKAHCLNCGADIHDAFCPHCGQSTATHVPSLFEFFHEFIGHHIALEGKLIATMWRLILLPGRLTADFIAGKRIRYIQPLRLYLTLSVIFFALLQFVSQDTGKQISNKMSEAKRSDLIQKAKQAGPQVLQAAKASGDISDEDMEAIKAALTKLPNGPKDSDYKGIELNFNDVKYSTGSKHIDEKLTRFGALPDQEKVQALQEGFFHYGTYAMFLLLPFFALGLKVLYLFKGRYYGEHLVFAFHTNSFAYFLMGIMLLIGDKSSIAQVLLFCWLLLYLPIAMRVVYRSSWIGTLIRWSILMFTYVFGIVAAFALAVFAGIAI